MFAPPVAQATEHDSAWAALESAVRHVVPRERRRVDGERMLLELLCSEGGCYRDSLRFAVEHLLPAVEPGLQTMVATQEFAAWSDPGVLRTCVTHGGAVVLPVWQQEQVRYITVTGLRIVDDAEYIEAWDPGIKTGIEFSNITPLGDVIWCDDRWMNVLIRLERLNQMDAVDYAMARYTEGFEAYLLWYDKLEAKTFTDR